MQNQNEQQNNDTQQTTRQQLQPAQTNVWSINKHNWGWFILAFCIPIVGYILTIVWWKSQPNNAHVSLLGALISSILGVLMYI